LIGGFLLIGYGDCFGCWVNSVSLSALSGFKFHHESKDNEVARSLETLFGTLTLDDIDG